MSREHNENVLMMGRSSRQTMQRTALFVMEQTLGHVTHARNLEALLPSNGELEPEFVPVRFETPYRAVPGWSNWTVRAGLRAGSHLLARRVRHPRPAAMFVHTQVAAVLLGPWMRRTPTVVSVDATPKQYDELGEVYAHDRSHPRIEDLKYRANRACFQRASHLVSWSHWGKDGLVNGYGIQPEKVSVIRPGVDIERWSRPASGEPRLEDPIRILFVGGDLRRKGGDSLVAVISRLRSDRDLPPLELHLVTGSDVERTPGVFVHHGLRPNSPELIALYHSADIFCLPTMGDCLPMVLAEAAAAGLPLVSTEVGAIGEIVRNGETGELVVPGDLDALALALRRLISDSSLRARYGATARRLAEAEHNAKTNAGRIAAILESLADGRLVSE